MWATAVIVFREILEVSLIISLVVAATQGIPRRSLYIISGILAGLVGAIVIAVFAAPIATFANGMGQEIFNASVLMLAVVMLTWHLVWMRKHSMQISSQINNMSQQLSQGNKSLYIISIIVGLAILREGAEIILLLYGMTAAGANVTQQLTGGSIGLVVGIGLGATIYFGLVKIPVRYFFKTTGILMLLLAAGLSAQAAAFLSQADVLPELMTTVWDTSYILSEQFLLGQILHSLIGYTSQPSGIQVIFYLGTILIISTLVKFSNYSPMKFRSVSLAGFVMATLVIVTIISTSPAVANDKIYSPHVEYGEFELEYRGHVTKDNDKAKDNNQKHRVEIGYGFTEYWSTAIVGEWVKESGMNREYEATAWENIFQLTEQGEHWVDVGLYLEYEFSSEANAADKIEAKLLLEKNSTQFSHTTNIIFEREIGTNSNSATELEIFWRTKYRWKEALEPAIEIYSKLGEIGNSGNFNSQNHSLGPVMLGKLRISDTSMLKYELGYLFGISDAAAQGNWKWLIEWETRF